MQTSSHSLDLSPMGHKTSLFPLGSLVVSVTFWLTALQCSGFMHCGVMLMGPKPDGSHLTLLATEGIGSLAVCNSELNLTLRVELNWPRSPEALRALKPLRAWFSWHPSSSASDTPTRECHSKATWRYGQDRNTELKSSCSFWKTRRHKRNKAAQQHTPYQTLAPHTAGARASPRSALQRE